MTPGEQYDSSSVRSRRGKGSKEVQVTWDGEVRGPNLPETAPGGDEWCEQTRKWWLTWRTSPQSMVMLDSDWEEMLICAILHNQLWSSGRLSGAQRAALATELRQRTARCGATFADRQSLGVRIKTPNEVAIEEKAITSQGMSAIEYAERLARTAAGEDID